MLKELGGNLVPKLKTRREAGEARKMWSRGRLERLLDALEGFNWGWCIRCAA